jgi:tetratricopeptide (TPR) repeat protein
VTRRALRRIPAIATALLALCALTATGQAPEQGGGGRQAAAPPKSVRATAAQFDQIVETADDARRAERWEDAIALYAKAVKLRPDFVEGYWYQGTAYYTLEKFSECRDAFRRVTRLSPKDGGAFAFLGLCEFGLKDYDRALQHLLQSRILGVGDKDLGGVASYHTALIMTRIELKRELALQPNHSASLLQIAYEYVKEKNAEAALPWAKQAVEVAPTSFGSHMALGDALLETGDIEGALRALQTAARLAPDSPSTRLSLAKAFQRAGRMDDAAREREEFARLDRLMRTTRSGAESVGGIDADWVPKEAAPSPQ